MTDLFVMEFCAQMFGFSFRSTMFHKDRFTVPYASQASCCVELKGTPVADKLLSKYVDLFKMDQIMFFKRLEIRIPVMKISRFYGAGKIWSDITCSNHHPLKFLRPDKVYTTLQHGQLIRLERSVGGAGGNSV